MHRLAVLAGATIAAFLAGLWSGGLAFAGLCGCFGYFTGQTLLSLTKAVN